MEKFKKNKNSAFGLVEFLITLVVIGIISVLSLNVIDQRIKKDGEQNKFMKEFVIKEIDKRISESGGGTGKVICDETGETEGVPKCSDHKDNFEPDKCAYVVVYQNPPNPKYYNQKMNALPEYLWEAGNKAYWHVYPASKHVITGSKVVRIRCL